MATSKEMQAQIETLQKEIAKVRKQEIAGAVEQVRTLISEHGLTLNDIGKRAFSKGRGVKAAPAAKGIGKGTVNPPKYKDPKTGATWTGRGPTPKWMAGVLKSGREAEFLIGSQTTVRKAKTTAKKAPAKKGAAKKTRRAT